MVFFLKTGIKNKKHLTLPTFLLQYIFSLKISYRFHRFYPCELFFYFSFVVIPIFLVLFHSSVFNDAMKAIVTIMPQPAVLDPAGVAAAHALEHLGLTGVRSVRIGKSISLDIEGATEEQLHKACRDLLSNPVMEDYHLEILS